MLDRTNRPTRQDRDDAKRTADKYITQGGDGRDLTATDNAPPGTIASAKEAMTELSSWLKEHPVIQTPTEAKDGGAYVERTRIAIAELETERTGKVAPLNKELGEINGSFRAVRDPLERALKELKGRLTKYAADLEAARIAEAERLRREAEAKERAAREAEAREREAIDDAAQGVESDVGGAIAEADQSFGDYRKADKAAAIAERNVPVRIGSVMGGRSLTMRTTRKLVVADAAAAIKVIGLTDEIADAITRAAKKFEDAFGELPAGVVETFERSM